MKILKIPTTSYNYFFSSFHSLLPHYTISPKHKRKKKKKKKKIKRKRNKYEVILCLHGQEVHQRVAIFHPDNPFANDYMDSNRHYISILERFFFFKWKKL